MFLNLLLVILVLVLVWVWVKWQRAKTYWAKRNVPYQPPHFLLGSLTFLQRENPALWMIRLFKQFRTPYVGIWLFRRPGLVVNSPDIARRVLVKDADNFRNRFLGSGTSDPLGGLNLFAVNDPDWTSARRRLTSVFTAAKLRAFQSIALRKCKLLVERIATDNKNGVEMELRSMFADYSTDVVGETSFGVVSDSITTGDSSLRYVTREIMEFSVFRGLSWCSIFFMPELVDYCGFSFFPKHIESYLRNLFRMTVDQHGGYEKEVTTNRDLVDALVKMRQDAAKEGQEMCEDFITAQASIFLQAGFDTSAVALTYIMYELAHAPEAQERVYQEIVAAKQSLGDKDFDSDTLSEMPYLNAVLKEVLRKYPAMGWLDRVASKAYKIDDNLTIEPGTVVYVNAVGMQWSEEYFPEPEKFIPERFLPENEDKIVPYTYMPFGDGPRHCIGERFGNQTVRFAMAEVLLNYEVKKIPNSKKPIDCTIEKKGLFFFPGEPMHVHFIPRK